MDILMVEDNPADVELVREALGESGMDAQLHWQPTGEEAMSFLRCEPPHQARPAPDLVLLDLNLPGMSGGDVLEAIKSDPSLLSLPVVVLTSSAARKDVLHAYQHHVNAYMVKPDNFDQFLQLVTSLRDYWLTRTVLPSRVR